MSKYTPEVQGIGLQNESSLHAALKHHYAKPNDRIEAPVDNYVVDVIREDGVLLEVQTSNILSMKSKLYQLSKDHHVVVIYPVIKDKWIVTISPEDGSQIRRRKSPKKGRVHDLCTELMRCGHIFTKNNIALTVSLIQVDEIRCPDGKGSWRRRGTSIIDRKLIEVLEEVTFSCPEDYLSLVPDDLSQPFTNKQLAKSAKIPIKLARKTTYALRRLEVLAKAGKQGRELLFERISNP